MVVVVAVFKIGIGFVVKLNDYESKKIIFYCLQIAAFMGLRNGVYIVRRS